MLESDDNTIEANIDELIEDKQIVNENIDGRDFLFIPNIYSCERVSAQRLSIMLKFPPPKGKTSIKNRINSLETKFNISYEDKQKDAITTALEKGMLILTGGPGTGKTTTLNGIIELYERDGLKVALTAPTGRAAKRMSEITGKQGKRK